MSFNERVRAQYDELMGRAAPGERRFREKAWSEFARLGLPGRKTETWKYSSLNPVVNREWPLSGAAGELPENARRVCDRWRAEFDLLVTVDGVFKPEWSTLGAGVKVETLELQESSDWSVEDGWSGLTAALARPGFSLTMEDGAKAKRPVLIVHAQSSPGAWSPVLNKIVLGRSAALELVEWHSGEDEYLRSSLTTVDLGFASSLNWVRAQEDSLRARHFSDVRVCVDERAVLNVAVLNAGGVWARSGLRVEMAGEAAEAHISGLNFARDHQHVDQRIEVRHLKGHTTSSQLFKGVLKDQSRGVMNGKIFIARDAQKVASSQLNHNLLLSPGAEADTKPELEIYADDVKANHGASIGRMDEDKVFYLMSRGIPQSLARQMLAEAFAGDVLMKIQPGPLRRFAAERVRALLPEFADGLERTQ